MWEIFSFPLQPRFLINTYKYSQKSFFATYLPLTSLFVTAASGISISQPLFCGIFFKTISLLSLKSVNAVAQSMNNQRPKIVSERKKLSLVMQRTSFGYLNARTYLRSLEGTVRQHKSCLAIDRYLSISP